LRPTTASHIALLEALANEFGDKTAKRQTKDSNSTTSTKHEEQNKNTKQNEKQDQSDKDNEDDHLQKKGFLKNLFGKMRHDNQPPDGGNQN
jgi:hypothetical protein